ncbi:MAG: hypothetical protein HLUCCA11_03375 [Phormidesmis priestleyi Ana]|uniref:Sporulation and spore germination n=1 Tax=Phormidesmis priestleyi Ana TaxID=1666911 RepID=A0A0N8KNM7_9CYAN|nr:MAG: hypothetical protein HLUCCA11_03375 [Phormidesmis priestleyi Ana]
MLYSVFRQMVRLPKYFPASFLESAPCQSSERPSAKLSPSEPAKKTAKRPFKVYATGLALALSLVVGGCATNAPEEAVVDPSPSVTPVAPSNQAKQPVDAAGSDKEPAVSAQPDGEGQSGKQPDAESEMVTVSVYTIDDQCNDFVEQSVQLPRDKAMVEAVGQSVNSVDYNAFKLEDYQVNINGNTAVVDMKLSSGSERQFVSLSSCEQRALFGSIEETLLKNPDWDIQSVKFTNDGQEIIL